MTTSEWVITGFGMLALRGQVKGAYVITECSKCMRMRKWMINEHMVPCDHKGPMSVVIE